MKLLKRLTIPTLALLALTMIGGCGKPLESGEGEAEGQRGRDSAALQEERQRAEADKLLQDGYVKIGQVLSMAHFAVQAKLPGNAGLTATLTDPEPVVEPVAETTTSEPATSDAGEVSDSASAPAEGVEPAAEHAPADASATEGATTDAATTDTAATDGAAAEGTAEGAAAEGVAGEDHQVTAADEGMVEPAGPVMPELLAQGTLANEMLGQAYALLEEVRAELAPLLTGEFDGVLKDEDIDRKMNLQDLLAAADSLVYAGAYLQPLNQDVVELIKQAREAAEAPAEGETAGAEGAAPAEGAPAAEGDAASSEAPAAEDSAPSSEAPATEGAATEAAPATAPAESGSH